MMKRLLLPALLTAVLSVSCDDSSTDATPSTNTPANASATATPASDATLPENLRLPVAPEGATEIAALKQTVKDGDKVVLRGVVAGRADPIAENRAIITLLDTSIQTCDKNPSDGCKTPWDACCEPADVLAKNSLTVQVVDGEGRPVKTSLANVEGVKPLAQLVVSGTAKVSADGVVLVNADGVHVMP
jgi:hypothetical protein